MGRDKMILYSRRRLAVERLLFLAVIGVLLFVVYRLDFPARVWVVSVAGESVAVVKNERTALEILDGLKAEYFPENPQMVVFPQQVMIQSVEADGEPVARWSDARRKLARVIKPAVQGFAIYVDDKPLAVLPTEAEAHACLEQVKCRYAPREGHLLSCQFKEIVRVKPVLTDPQRAREILKTQPQAVEVLTSPALQPTSYVVQSGDTLAHIAQRFGITLNDLQYHNPGIDAYRLRVGDRLIVGGGNPPVTVVTRVEVMQLENAVPPWTVRERTASLPRGQVKVAQQGSPAKQRVRSVVTYVNGQEKIRRATYEDIVQEAVPRKILVGTG
jgi:LysM repeat protein